LQTKDCGPHFLKGNLTFTIFPEARMKIDHQPVQAAVETRQSEFADQILSRLLTGYVILLYSIQVLAILAGVLKLPMSLWMARLILAFAIAVAILLFLVPKFPVTRPLSAKLRSSHFLVWGFAAISLGIYIILCIAAYHMPDLSYDGNSYHIPTISMWDQAGYVHWVETPYLESSVNGYPKGAELIAYVLVKAFNNQIINMINLIFLPLGVFGIMLLARRLDVQVPLAVCAGLTFILVPINIGQSPTTYVDSAFASSVVGFLALTFSLVKFPGLNIKHLAVIGASMGLMISVKSTGIAVAGLGSLTMMLLLMVAFRHTGLEKHPLSKSSALKPVFAILAGLLITGTVALAGGYWYIRNYLVTGSPLYPVGLDLFGIHIFPGISISESIFSSQVTPEKIQTWPVALQVLYTWAQSPGDWPESILGYDSSRGGLGYLWIIGCVPSIVLMAIAFLKSKRNRKWGFALLFAITTAAFLVTPLRWWARYTLWIYALGLPCLAFTFDRIIGGANNFLNKIGRIWMIFCTGILVIEAGYSTINVIALASPQPLRSNLTHIFDRHIWEWPVAYLFPAMQDTVIEEILSGNEPVAMGPHGDNDFWHYAGLIGQLSQPIGARQMILLHEDNIQAQLQSNPVKYIIWDKTIPIPAELDELAVRINNVDQFIVLTLR
jgi:hypothetical protein